MKCGTRANDGPLQHEDDDEELMLLPDQQISGRRPPPHPPPSDGRHAPPLNQVPSGI